MIVPFLRIPYQFRIFCLCIGLGTISILGLNAQTMDKQGAIKEFGEIKENWNSAKARSNQYAAASDLSTLLSNAELGWAHADSLKIDWHLQLGLWYTELDEPQKAKENYQISLDLLQKKRELVTGDSEKLIQISRNLGLSATTLGQWNAARAAFENAIRLTDSLPTQQAGMFLDLARMLRTAGKYAEATDLAQRAVKMQQALLKGVKEPVLKANLTSTYIDAVVEVAHDFNGWGMPDSAFWYLDQTKNLRNNLKKSETVKLWLAFSEYHYQKQEFEPALEAADIALEAANADSLASKRLLGTIHTLRAKSWLARKEPTNALAASQAALMAFVPGFQDSLPGMNPDPNLWADDPALFEIFLQKAHAFEALGLVEQSLRCYENAFDYLNHLREGHHVKEVGKFSSKAIYPSYERALKLALAHASQTKSPADLERVFHFMECRKTNEILLSLQSASAYPAYQLPDSLLAQWRTIQSRRLEMHRHPTEKSIEFLTKLDKQAAQLASGIDTVAPGFAALTQRYGMVSVASVQQDLDADEVFLEYFIGDQQLFIFAIDQQHAQCYSAPLKPEFFKAIERFGNMLRTPPEGRIRKLFSEYERTAYYLFGQLIGPLIKGNFRTRIPRALIIVPDGRLALIPFECLITQRLLAPSDLAFRHAAYLMRDCEIRYGHSATTLARQNQPAGHPQTAFMRSILALSASPQADGMPKLETAKREGRLAADALNGKSIDKASRNDFLDNSRDYSFLHFASPTIADSLNPIQSWIGLQKDDKSIDSLFFHEITGLQLSAEMAVLSGCATSSGELQSGEAVMGLARTFFAASCPRVMLSLWRIDNENNAELTGNFYKTMKVGKPAAQALREARMAYLRTEGPADGMQYHPHYWASMVMIGEEGPYLTQGPKSWTPYLIWGSIAALIVALWQRRMRRRRRKAH